MHVRTLKITDKKMERMGDVWVFRVRGEGGSMQKGIMFEQLCHNHELSPVKIDEINEKFRNSLRYVKHFGGYCDETAEEKDMEAAMNKLSSTAYGVGIKIKDDPLKEFQPFTL